MIDQTLIWLAETWKLDFCLMNECEAANASNHSPVQGTNGTNGWDEKYLPYNEGDHLPPAYEIYLLH